MLKYTKYYHSVYLSDITKINNLIDNYFYLKPCIFIKN